MRAPAATHIASQDEGKSPRELGWVIAIIGIATALRLAIAALLPYGVDEAYAVGVARAFSLSYFDHPPLHFWLVGLWGTLLGAESPLLLRLPFVALGALSSWLMYRLAGRLFGSTAGVWAVLVLNLTLVFGLGHLTLILPDGPLLAAALLLANILCAILFAPRDDRETGRWLLVGVAAGLAMLSKYHGVLLVGGVLLFLVTSAPHRVWLTRPGPWLAALLAAVMFAPVIWWNATHGWASIAFQAGRGGGGGTADPMGPVLSLLQQSVYLVPWVALGLAAAVIAGLVSGPRQARRWLLVCLALPPILLFTGVTLYRAGLPHWQMPGWLFAIPLLGERLARLGPYLSRAATGMAMLTALVLALLSGAVLAQTRWGSLDQVVAAYLPSDPTDMLQSWVPVRESLAERGLPADARTVVIAFNWTRAGHLNALLGRELPVICLCGDARHFRYLNPPADYAGWTGIVIDTPGTMANTARLEAYFDTLGPMERIDVTRGGRSVIPLGLRIGTGFRPDGRATP